MNQSIIRSSESYSVYLVLGNWYLFMHNFCSIWYSLRVLLEVSANFPDNLRMLMVITVCLLCTLSCLQFTLSLRYIYSTYSYSEVNKTSRVHSHLIKWRWYCQHISYTHWLDLELPYTPLPPGGFCKGIFFWTPIQNATKWAMLALWRLGRLGFLG